MATEAGMKGVGMPRKGSSNNKNAAHELSVKFP